MKWGAALSVFNARAATAESVCIQKKFLVKIRSCFTLLYYTLSMALCNICMHYIYVDYAGAKKPPNPVKDWMVCIGEIKYRFMLRAWGENITLLTTCLTALRA